MWRFSVRRSPVSTEKEPASPLKLARSGALTDPMKAPQAMSRLSASERRAWLEAAGQQQDQMPQPSNRAERRRLERLQRETQRRPKR